MLQQSAAPLSLATSYKAGLGANLSQKFVDFTERGKPEHTEKTHEAHERSTINPAHWEVTDTSFIVVDKMYVQYYIQIEN